MSGFDNLPPTDAFGQIDRKLDIIIDGQFDHEVRLRALERKRLIGYAAISLLISLFVSLIVFTVL